MSWSRRIIKESNVQFFTRDTKNGEQSILAPLEVGDERYEIYDILSVAGGFGIIYRARDTRLKGHEVLVKSRRYDGEPGLFMHKYDQSREKKIEEIRDKTLFEAECLKLFKHNRESRMPILNDVVWGFSPSIYGPHKDVDGSMYYINDEYVKDEPYIVMQVVSGVNLGDYVKKGIPEIIREKGYSCYYEWERDVLEYVKELTTIFAGFHKPQVDEKGNTYQYIYQDLKPENIILSHDRFITLLDFGGITRIRIKEDGTTQTGNGSPGLGTFGFQAPEARNQTLIKCLDQRCDIYTLGATMYQLLTGYDMTDVLENEDSVLPFEKQLKGVCTDATYNVMKKCLGRDRNHRYGSMEAVRKDIVDGCFKEVKTQIRKYM